MTPVSICCPHCLTTNRVPASRLVDRPRCGRCHQDLFDGQPLEFDPTALDVFLARNDTPVLVDFWAPWCGPCLAMAPVFASLATEFSPRVRFVKIDTERHGATSARYGIRSIPLLVLFHRGQEVARQAGALSTANLRSWLQDVLPDAA